MVGPGLGRLVGLRVGADVNKRVGSAVVGIKDGIALDGLELTGTLDGSMERVGFKVGTMVGLLVGTLVGLLVGKALGLLEGMMVDGESDGDEVAACT